MNQFVERVLVWWPVALVMGQVALGWMSWKLSRQFATRGELKEQAEKIEKHDTRIGNVEGKVLLLEKELKHLPTSADLCQLKESIAVFSQSTRQLQVAVTRIENYLMERAK